MKYRNISEQKQSLIGFGVVNPGETIETKKIKINNPNFKLVSEEPKRRKISAFKEGQEK